MKAFTIYPAIDLRAGQRGAVEGGRPCPSDDLQR